MATRSPNELRRTRAASRAGRRAVPARALPVESADSQSLRFKALAEHSPLAVIEWDSNHRVVSWTGNAKSIFGWDASEVLGKRPDEWRFVHEDDWGKVRVAIDAVQSGCNFISRHRNYRKDGSLVHCEWYTSVISDSSGSFRGALSLVLDTTARDQAEEESRISERKYRDIVETAPIGIFQSTLDGKLLSVNARLASLFAYPSPEEMVASVRNLADDLYVHRETRFEVLARASKSFEFITREVEFRRRNGSTFFANLYLRAVRDTTGNVVHLEGFIEDITEQKQAVQSLWDARDALEERVRERTAELSAANERLQELDRLKSQFLASMSHELRTPLNSIIGFTSLLHQELTGALNPEQKKQLGIVRNSAQHLLTLINDLLDVSRIEAGRADIERRRFDFADVMEEALHSLSPMAERKSLELSGDLSTPAIPMLGDRKRTLQVLLNLVNNAIKFTQHGRVTVHALVEGDRLRVVVRDTGIGINAEHIGMLFEAFRQVDGTAKRIYEGTGLGLYLCRKLLHLMGGEIQVESVYGAGSSFTFNLPLQLAPETEESP